MDTPWQRAEGPFGRFDDVLDHEPEHQDHRDHPEAQDAQTHNQEQPNARIPKLKARRCRICFDEVTPTYEEPSFVDQLRGKAPRRTYYSEDGGHLISPCLCKGSMKYIHENCLQEWRYGSVGRDNVRKCPSCKYEYKLMRVTWAKWARSRFIAFGLAVFILVLAIFLLGFVADPIVSLWLDPVGTITDGVGLTDIHDRDIDMDVVRDLLDEDEGWTLHFLKGTTALGLLGFVKSFLAMSPWQWWNLRTSGLMGGGNGRRRGGGRERVENVSLVLVVIGVFTFFWAVWTGTRRWTQQTLDRASDKIINVQSIDDDDDDDDDEGEEVVPESRKDQ